ncbi:thioesterase family protein [Pseudomonas aeruginosa]|uniref:thioesterase family protein n=1 Tax=Pseudomonas aeruginosa TaxID=287 RepID=UPI000EB2A587|nr:thioesterase family protein [Pseudomonas aeruginosa]EIU1413950.1 thioesterase family protein [Pseudomonas aeruginosa]MCG9956498.1 thioesterase family protein [Pseudomonas aeruginosa]RPW10810.1 acyl-CoA thioesterase [Pseudomonas aeruginosa]RTB51797.1 thioesterase family protein [Pseudomonas aeruginosa]RTC34175.1 thioesterase family protein [Pseudomonas aeruginosa]
MTNVGDSTLTGFSSLLSDLTKQGDTFNIELPHDWLQGRTAYGGLSAALCLEATIRSFPTLPPLRSAHFSFLGPAVGELSISSGITRQGKSTAFAQAEVVGEMGVAAQASFCFGSTRLSEYSFSDLPTPETLPPDDCEPYFSWMNRPNFMQHFDGRLVSGARPCTAGKQPEMLVWLRHKDRAIDSSLVGLLALADALPPAIFVMFREPVPISTVTWSVDFLDESFENNDGWWLVRSAAESARNGFSTQVISIWASDGRPVLSARQNVAVFGNATPITRQDVVA